MMENNEMTILSCGDAESGRVGKLAKVVIPVPPPANAQNCSSSWDRAKYMIKETLFPDDPFRDFRNSAGIGTWRKCLLALRFLFPILEWAPNYSLRLFKSDIISGMTIASLAIPQGISYAQLAKLPPIIGLYSSFLPPIIYAVLGSSRDLAVGTVAVVSLLLASRLGAEASPEENPTLYIGLVFTATLIAGIFQASLGLLRLGFVIEFMSHATIQGFMAGAATIVCLQQLKVFLGLNHFTHRTDVVSVVKSIAQHMEQSKWESTVMGLIFLTLLLWARAVAKRNAKFFTLAAGAPLISVALGSLLVFATHAHLRGIQIVGHLKKGLNPPSWDKLVFNQDYLKTTVKTGIVAGIISLTEGIAVGRTFSAVKNYHIDGSKEMIAIGVMNIVGSCASCYITTGPFSRSAVNFNAGCKTAMSNMVMAVLVMITLLFLTFLFYYTPMVVLSAIIVSAMLGLIDVQGAYHLWRVDKPDFLVCLIAYLGVIFTNVQLGLVLSVAVSMMRLLLQIIRPHVTVLHNIPGTNLYRNKYQYTDSDAVPGLLILSISSPILFANSNYLRERIMRWIEEEEKRLASLHHQPLHSILLDMTGVTAIDTSGLCILQELMKSIQIKEMELAIVNPGVELMEKMYKSSRYSQLAESKSIFCTVQDAVSHHQNLLSTSNVSHCNV